MEETKTKSQGEGGGWRLGVFLVDDQTKLKRKTSCYLKGSGDVRDLLIPKMS